MKKYTKRVVILCLAILLIVTSIVTAFAETIYSYQGYLYTYISNSMVSLYGLEESTDYLLFPDVLNNRNVVDVRNNAFKDNDQITGIYFSPGCNLMRIGSFTFKGCTALSGTLVLPPSLTTIESAAFQECTSLEGVVIDNAVEDISNQAFYMCSSLKNVTLGENVRTIGDYAFADCPSLDYVEIPSGVTYIADTAFLNDTDLEFGVYYDTPGYWYAVNRDMSYVVLDPENIPTEPPTEAPTEAPTEPVTETPEPTAAPTELPTESMKLLLGDANGDGGVDIIDATIIQRVLANIQVEKYDALASDVDGNGEVDIIDVTFIMRYCSQIPTAYSIGEWIDR